jgi:hypothetical protein
LIDGAIGRLTKSIVGKTGKLTWTDGRTPPNTPNIRRIWQARSLLCGVDITYGMAPAMARACEVAASELDGLEEVQ